MQLPIWDVIIIGAGPAGLMGAIVCGANKLQTLVLDSQKKIGAKLLISGGGRCNVAPLKAVEDDYRASSSRTVRNILRAFPTEKTLKFFKGLDIEMVLEEGTKFFPEEQSSKIILEALVKEASARGVHFENPRKVLKLSLSSDLFQVHGEGFQYSSKTILMATGGLSYPKTGSDGSGYKLAQGLGHTIVATTPALVPLVTDDPDWKKMTGITLSVKLTVEDHGHRIATSEGALLFTHKGLSGPAVLDMSGSWIRCRSQGKKLFANFLPGYTESQIRHCFIEVLLRYPKRGLKHFLASFFPERLSEVIIKKTGLPCDISISQIRKEHRNGLLNSLFHFPLEITGALGYEKAEITAGGVDLKEVDEKSLESRLRPGLFFAGEMLDVDGRIGGFNLQWAWASGRVAGEGISKKLGSLSATQFYSRNFHR